MKLLPIFLDVKDQPCLVVGGGEVAARKVALLRRAAAHVTVIAPRLCASLAELAQSNAIAHKAIQFASVNVSDFMLIVAATDDLAVNREVSEAARARGIPVNVVDQPTLCSFVMPSIVDRSPVIIAVSSGGTSPVLARLLRARLETLVPASYGKLATLVGRFRAQVKAKFKTTAQRRRFWEKILQGPIAEMLLAGQEKAAQAALETAVQQAPGSEHTLGEVYVVGGGPGDPDLLTFRALRLMQQADVVLYDRLVGKQVLDLVRRDAERIYVGKKREVHAVRQEEIHQLMVKLARQGKRVLRLKGGDPFIFGRGGEEIGTLAEEGIPFQVVPGVTAASGCAAYAGIPLTHRDYAQSCIFVTGHQQDDAIDLNWGALVQPQQTVVVYMGLKGLPIICRELIAHGMASDTPVALVEQGTTAQQRVFIGTLRTLPDIVSTATVHAPTLIIVGEVVRLHQKLAWFEPVSEIEDAAQVVPHITVDKPS
jgi:uroporphyrin-III C-methyltransferase/precorrin-2 dehydrogenase/sirohydrochlorin ferrochelatase